LRGTLRPVRRLGCFWIDINGDVGFWDGGSFPLVEEFFDNLENKDGVDWLIWVAWLVMRKVTISLTKKVVVLEDFLKAA